MRDRLEPLRALITGGTGFIGSHLVRRLRRAGWVVHRLLRQPSYGTVEEHAHLYNGDVADVIQAVERSKPDVVFHLASLFLTEHTPGQIAPLIDSNVLLGTQLLEAMQRAGAKFLVNAGTSWQHFYGDDYLAVNLYAATKQAFEDILAYYANVAEMRVISLALFDSYGPGDTRRKLLPSLLTCLKTGEPLQMSPGEQVLDLAHVDDICSAFLYAAELLQDPKQPTMACYAVSGGERMTLRAIVSTLEEVAGRRLHIDWGARPYRKREVMRPWDGPALPGWRSTISLRKGFGELVGRSSL